MSRLLAIACLAGLGCAPVQSATAISGGAEALAEAERQAAPKYAKYEYAKAEALLEEAKTKQGYAEYEVARQYADQARELALEASKAAVRRRDMELRRVKKPAPPHGAPLPPPLPPATPTPGGQP